MVIIFLVVPHPGNQVGPVTTSMYSCHTHELCPSILHWRVEHRKRQSHCLPFPIPASHACESYFKNEHSNKCSWKSMELGHRGQHMHVSQPSLYTERARTCAHTHTAPSVSESAADIKTLAVPALLCSPNQYLTPATQVQNSRQTAQGASTNFQLS